ncbi:hypothetical protein SARC_02453 [Sphaeroforma arctica JP610]|uniref:Uncharacterized protein n=1 Tax=Sphaeroforma arctica JP610 TaxID=667725 RepID=A0A0L0G905_9EUKA|nr:hypothetical protein SARC_02453 [Sphaeroforma arctica JP610]KNC85361.1 hypothetical protein SARC_02453 [Sphaeroforma arctica JP610]|eukprot:XP_014159263.1 hypothetical protein SARC_02453 [Sphaeroforma arctica JP610]
MPWESTIFGFYTCNSPNNIVPMERQPVYRNDAFGLRTLHENGRLHLKPVYGLEHNDWIHNTEFVINNIIPLMCAIIAFREPEGRFSRRLMCGLPVSTEQMNPSK